MRKVDTQTMPDLKKALGELYDSAPGVASPNVRSLDDDLAAALSAALVSAPAADAGAPVVPDAPAAPVAPALAPTRLAAGVAGTLREFRQDPADRTPAEAQPAAAAAAGVTAAAPAAPLPGPPWRREDDDILPSGGGRSGRGRHRGRR